MLDANLQVVLRAVRYHPGIMSPILLEYLLRGERIGRMEEKGLLTSPFFGALQDLPSGDVAHLIAEALLTRWLLRSGGFYPALRLSASGEAQLLVTEGEVCKEVAPETAYRAYYRWRRQTALRKKTPAYRILPNAILSTLAARRPVSISELLEIPGLGKRRALRYHEELLAIGSSVQNS